MACTVRVSTGVLKLMGTMDTSWTSMRNFLGQRGVKEDIQNFDARRITPASRAAVEELLRARRESFDPKVAGHASQAAPPLVEWVRANVQYSYILQKIEPLEAEQNELKKYVLCFPFPTGSNAYWCVQVLYVACRRMEKSESKLTHLTSGLSVVDAKVADLRAKFEKATTEAAKLKLELSKARETIDAAESLVGKLDDEYRRWSTQMEQLAREHKSLPLQALVCAAFLTYLGSAPEDARGAQLQRWTRALMQSTSAYS